MIRLVTRPLLWATYLFCLAVIPAWAQTDEPLAANWQSLAPEQFSAELKKHYLAAEDHFYFEMENEQEIRAHAATLFSQIDLSNTELSYETIDVINGLALPNLDESVREKTKDLLEAKPENWQGKSYNEVRGKYSLLDRNGSTEEFANAIVKAWADAGGDLTEIWTDDLLNMREVVSGWKELRTSCTVTFAGKLTAPTAGQYKLSVPNLNLSARVYRHHERYDLLRTVTLSVGGEEIIKSTPENFAHEAQPIQLAANQAIDFKLEIEFDTLRMPKYVTHAIVYWEGPGIVKSVIAPQNFKNSEGNSTLTMTHRWDEDGEPQSFSQTVDNIDWGWTDRVSFYTDPTYQKQIGDVLWDRVMAPAFINDCWQNGKRHTFLKHAEDTVECFSTAQCTTFLNTVLSQPELLRPFQLKEMVDVYRAFRLKAPVKALDLFGVWATQNADHGCRMPHEYLDRMKHFREFHGFDFYPQRAYRFMAICVGKQCAEHTDLLRDEYLETEAGGCCLPVAYTLAYAYQGQGRFDEWVQLLVEKLNDDQLQGEQRVNWLLARAQAHDIRLGPHGDPYAIINPRPMDGLTYIEEAILAAETPETKLRLAKNRAARLASVRKFDAARQVLQQASESAPANRAKFIERCQDCVNRFETFEAAQKAAQPAAAENAYIERLKKRRDKAQARGDSAGVNRYNNLIQAAENK